MSGQISESKINEIRERTDIVELISQYVSLKHSGANHTGLCPFHSEKTPSFSVNSARQFFHCFGCGVGGDVFSFLMKTEGLVFPDAVRLLAERAGVELEEHIPTPEEEQRERQRERLYRVNEVAAAYFHQLLMEHPSGEPARQYMKLRGYGRKASGEYQIGYALDSWDGLRTHLEEQGLAADDARILGLLRPGKQDRGDYDLFRGRLIFPVYDLSGRIVAFAGRVLDDSKPKYINSPESPVYHKGRILFGLYQARQAMRQCGEVLLVEGYFDQLALYRAGFPQVVATCGTALTSDHAQLLKRYVQRVVLLFDQDAAGKKATFKAMTVLQEEGIPAAVIELPKGEDPDSFIQMAGKDAFRARLEKARSAMDLFMEDVLTEAGNGIEQKVRAAEQIVEQISKLSSELEQDLYLKELAQRSGIDLEQLKQVNRRIVGRVQQHKNTFSAPPVESYPLPEPPLPEERHEQHLQPAKESGSMPDWSRSEETLLCLLLQNHVSHKKILMAGGLALFNHQEARDVAEILLEKSTDSGLDLATLADELAPDKVRLLTALSLLDKGQFDEGVDEVFSGCLEGLQRELKKRQRQESIDKLRKLEQGGDTGTMKDANNLLKQFKNLK
ncbi:DNA primase [uncultured Desulfuromusa sp.]|uniref:DNA primase n=1 Tax=uncultured Desulfuromusa sp. TaxID=219183 RepID=UPI002AA641B8|nr:DNA primase [uncultured Desulfuromusa sp.]